MRYILVTITALVMAVCFAAKADSTLGLGYFDPNGEQNIFSESGVIVVINGESWQCFKEQPEPCHIAEQRAKVKFQACAGYIRDEDYKYTLATCWRKAYKDDRRLDCIQWTRDCNLFCRKAYGNQESCYQDCFED